ncbi:MAG TPA: hypothetical protein QGF02_04260 [Candidatus Babeliales bacterium]|nr:hypothetical protein [Candidatus Babeliales bacterium]
MRGLFWLIPVLLFWVSNTYVIPNTFEEFVRSKSITPSTVDSDLMHIPAPPTSVNRRGKSPRALLLYNKALTGEVSVGAMRTKVHFGENCLSREEAESIIGILDLWENKLRQGEEIEGNDAHLYAWATIPLGTNVRKYVDTCLDTILTSLSHYNDDTERLEQVKLELAEMIATQRDIKGFMGQVRALISK